MPPIFSWFANINPFNPTSPVSYARAHQQPVCLGNQQVCAIYAEVDCNNFPIITEALNTEIITALNTHMNTTNVRLRA